MTLQYTVVTVAQGISICAADTREPRAVPGAQLINRRRAK